MASARQVCSIIDAVLRLPENTCRWHADRLRGAGLLPATQGRPEPLDDIHVSRLLLSVLVGTADLAGYLNMRPIAGGETFGDTLAGFISAPNDLLDLRIDAVAPGATLTFRGADNGVRTSTFASAEPQRRPGFNREVTVPPGVFVHLSAAIRAAPIVRVGRRRNADRYARHEI